MSFLTFPGEGLWLPKFSGQLPQDVASSSPLHPKNGLKRAFAPRFPAGELFVSEAGEAVYLVATQALRSHVCKNCTPRG